MASATAHFCVASLATAFTLGAGPASAQSDPGIELVVRAGRSLRVALTDTTTIRRVGQAVAARLIEPVYAYDRIVLPVGAQVSGHVVQLDNPTTVSRVRSVLSGDFSPHRVIVLQFDSIMRDGVSMPIETIVRDGVPHMTRQIARTTDGENNRTLARAKQNAKERVAGALAAVKQKIADTTAAVKEPGRTTRVKGWAIDRLPYHPQVLRKGTVYDAELRTSLAFGSALPRRSAPESTTPAPSSILSARLITTLDSSSRASRGTPLEAAVTEPVFAEDGRLIFPEGTKLTGEVTFARPARRFHRNGQLRFLFERVVPPDHESAPLVASLHAVDVSQDERVVLDDEGGAAVMNSKARFVTPALAILAMRASVEQGEGRGFERDANAAQARTTSASAGSGNIAGRGLSGFIGFGLIGVGLSQISRPLGLGFAVAGAVRSVYTNILGKGQDLRFQPDTPIQVQLAPGPPATE